MYIFQMCIYEIVLFMLMICASKYYINEYINSSMYNSMSIYLYIEFKYKYLNYLEAKVFLHFQDNNLLLPFNKFCNQTL